MFRNLIVMRRRCLHTVLHAGRLGHTRPMRGQQARGRNKLSAGMCLAGCTQAALEVTKQILKAVIPESKMHKFEKIYFSL